MLLSFEDSCNSCSFANLTPLAHRKHCSPRFLSEPLIALAANEPKLDAFITPVISGYVHSETCQLQGVRLALARSLLREADS